MSFPIGARLLAAKSLVREGAVFADVGTDHGYLPIALLREGKIRRAILTDLREGPLAAAKENILRAGLSDRAEFLLTDGAAALEGCGVTDLAICGMGGELIAGILTRAPFLCDGDVRLILQPMTRIAFLRRALAERGFSVSREVYAVEGGKPYVCLAAGYAGSARNIPDAEAEFGSLAYRLPETPEEKAFFCARRRTLENAMRGKLRGGEDATYERDLLAAQLPNEDKGE